MDSEDRPIDNQTHHHVRSLFREKRSSSEPARVQRNINMSRVVRFLASSSALHIAIRRGSVEALYSDGYRL
jgi:hypothetical protein